MKHDSPGIFLEKNLVFGFLSHVLGCGRIPNCSEEGEPIHFAVWHHCSQAASADWPANASMRGRFGRGVTRPNRLCWTQEQEARARSTRRPCRVVAI